MIQLQKQIKEETEKGDGRWYNYKNKLKKKLRKEMEEIIQLQKQIKEETEKGDGRWYNYKNKLKKKLRKEMEGDTTTKTN